MKVTLLGSGGFSPTPRPTCQCDLCREAREKGGKHVRKGNSTFFHDDNILLDTPESVMQLLNENDIGSVDAVLFSHFHPDHTMGLRAISQMCLPEDTPFDGWEEESIDVFMSRDTRDRLDPESSVPGYLLRNNAKINIVEDGDEFTIGETHVTAIGWKESPESEQKDVFGYLLERDGVRVFASPDENKNLPISRLPSLDLWIKECGLFRKGPDGDKLRTDRFWDRMMKAELSFQQSRKQAKKADVDKVVFTEIEEVYRRRPEDYRSLSSELGESMEFGYDGLKVEL